MAIDDATFAQYPDEFLPRRSVPKTVTLAVIGGVFALLAVLAVVFFADVRDLALQWEGRRSGLAPLVAPGAVALCVLLAVVCVGLLLAESTVWHRAATGTPMRRTVFLLADDATADSVHERLRSGDPAVYRPIPAGGKGPVLMRLYRADADDTAYFTIQRGKGKGARTWPLITFSGPAYASLKPLTAESLVRGPGGGFDALEQSLRDMT